MDLPLFPLNTVLCPGIALRLHIFEERYRAMVRHCLDTSSPFGVVLIRQGRETGVGAISFSGVGTVAEIRDAGRHDDGRYDLLVAGTRRFEIRNVLNGKGPYLVADVNILEEVVGDDRTAHGLAMNASRRFVTYLELLQPRGGETAEEIDVQVEVETSDEDDDADGDAVTGDDGASTDPTADQPDAESFGRPDLADAIDSTGEQRTARDAATPRHRRVTIPNDPTVLSYLLAGILQVESPRRQALLEADTTEDRLRAILGLIDRETLLLQRRLRFFRPDPRLVGARRS